MVLALSKGTLTDVGDGRSNALQGYLDQLPRGLHSYPECTTEILPMAGVADADPMAALARHAKAQAIDIPIAKGEGRHTQVVAVAATMARRDQDFENDDAMLAFLATNASFVLGTGLSDRLSRLLLPPNRLVKALPKAWGRSFVGTHLTMHGGLRSGEQTFAKLALSYPRAIFPELYLRALGAMICNSLKGSGAIEAQSKIISRDEHRALFHLAWR